MTHRNLSYTKGITYNAGNYQSIKLEYGDTCVIYEADGSNDQGAIGPVHLTEQEGTARMKHYVERNLVIDLKSLGAQRDTIVGFGLDPDITMRDQI